MDVSLVAKLRLSNAVPEAPASREVSRPRSLGPPGPSSALRSLGVVKAWTHSNFIVRYPNETSVSKINDHVTYVFSQILTLIFRNEIEENEQFGIKISERMIPDIKTK